MINPSLLAAALVLSGIFAHAASPFDSAPDSPRDIVPQIPVNTGEGRFIEQDRYVVQDQTAVYELPSVDSPLSLQLRNGEPVKLIGIAAPPNNDGWQLIEANRIQYDENGEQAKIRGWVKRKGITGSAAENVLYADIFKSQPTQKTGECRERFVAQLKKYLGVPYVWGGNGPPPNGVDCSGLVVAALLEARCTSKAPPRTARDQQKAAARKDKPEVGDLIFTGNPAKHVVVYLGEEKVIEAQQKGTNVSINPAPSRGDLSYGDLLTALGEFK